MCALNLSGTGDSSPAVPEVAANANKASASLMDKRSFTVIYYYASADRLRLTLLVPLVDPDFHARTPDARFVRFIESQDNRPSRSGRPPIAGGGSFALHHERSILLPSLCRL